MNPEALRRHRAVNAAQSFVLIATMAVVAGGVSWLVAGPLALVPALLLVGGAFLGAGRLAPRMILRAYRARPIHPAQAPELHEVVHALARRAELPRTPELFYLPSDVMNAFAVGLPGSAAIVLSDGVLRRLNLRELAGVLAHEISHVRNRDTRLMGFADLATRLTAMVAQLGLALAVITLPLQLLGLVEFPLLLVLLLLVAPTLSTLVQLALSRTREYEADLEAARLLGDPRPLAAALQRMQHFNAGRPLEQLLPLQPLPEPSLLRSHPPTDERIRRLGELATPEGPPRVPWSASPTPGRLVAREPIRPRWHRASTWF